ncbi:conserved hypothetical protein [Burkholderiales bacterium 8X]|nr:conserved hypothetical protein [Burkholderiales bacterium 8X]
MLSLGIAPGAHARPVANDPQPLTRNALQEDHRRWSAELAGSPLGRPIHLVSRETDHGLQGEIWAVLDHPFAEARAVFVDPAQWCEMLLLHINNRRCQVRTGSGGGIVALGVVRRYDKPVEDAFDLRFEHRVGADAPDHVGVMLTAREGPLGTSEHRVVIEAMPLGERQVFVHFSYAYEHNLMARMATSAYLATFGSYKRGFTVIGRAPDAGPVHIRGMRGLMERNAMRYFLTLDAYLDGGEAPAGDRFELRLKKWFDGIERYPAQLHEVDFKTYAELKRADRQRGDRP